MPRPIPLKGSPYDTRDPIAAARRCVNLYPERNGEDAVFPFRYWPTPGLRTIATTPNGSPVRGEYTASNGDLFVAAGDTVYYVGSDLTFQALGMIAEQRTPITMTDNGDCLVICDGTPAGYAVDLKTKAFASINDEAFYGADRVDYCDTYFIFNRPDSRQWYISRSQVSYGMLTQTPEPVTASIEIGSVTVRDVPDTASYSVGQAVSGDGVPAGTTIAAIPSGTTLTLSQAATSTFDKGTIKILPGTAFDSLDISAKTGGADTLATIIVKSREVWLIGTLTSEVWYNAGSADFAFAQMPGSFIDHGCVARYSVAKQDVSLFWLARDREGQGIIVRTDGYGLKRISTHAIEAEIRGYGTISDAIGFCFQQNGHAFYAITFPTADKTWCYDLQAGEWHEWAWMDGNGVLHRHRANTHTFAYGRNIVGDWQNGKLYALDPEALTDDGAPIPRIRTFPHLQGGGNLTTFNRFILDVQVGADVSGGVLGSPDVTLRYSHNCGANWSEALLGSLGLQGEYATQVAWWGLGCGRDTVFEVSYAAPVQAAFGGAYVETEAHDV